jgi:hypothetical protein
MKLNMTVSISRNLLLNPEIALGLDRIHDMFTKDIALPFTADWTRRAVRHGYLSASVLYPSPCPFLLSPIPTQP